MKKEKGSSIETGRTISATDNIMILSVMKAEKGDGFILRSYEPYGTKVNDSVHFDKQYTSIIKCNLKNEEKAVMGSGGSVFLRIKPFETITLMLKQLQQLKRKSPWWGF
ncbi:MAG TPA: hypothetical protein DC053_07915 [Lachnoclostridium sp.]|nr:hypothetical protein [Lachnoclostridium sp.]